MEEQYLKYVPVFKALSDETRLQILDMLSSKEMCACKILAPFHIRPPTLSYHMRILMESGLVTSRKEGPWVYYRMDPRRMEEVQQFLAALAKDKE